MSLTVVAVFFCFVGALVKKLRTAESVDLNRDNFQRVCRDFLRLSAVWRGADVTGRRLTVVWERKKCMHG